MSIPQINKIGIPTVGVQKIEVPNVYNLPVNQGTVPFILNIGSPVVDLPGCVAVSYTHLTLPTIYSV